MLTPSNRQETRQPGHAVQDEDKTQLEPKGRWRVEDRVAEVTRRDVWRLLYIRREGTGFYGWTRSEPECSTQLLIRHSSESKKTSRVDMDTLTTPAPAAGVTCTFRV